jgi:hypothetical protein
MGFENEKLNSRLLKKHEKIEKVASILLKKIKNKILFGYFIHPYNLIINF